MHAPHVMDTPTTAELSIALALAAVVMAALDQSPALVATFGLWSFLTALVWLIRVHDGV